MRDVLKEITDAVIAKLEAGVMPWRKPWIDGKSTGEPHNAVSGRAYSGLNYLQLTMIGTQYASNGWLTFRQAKQLGGTVRKGESGTHVVFFKPMKCTNKAGEPDSFLLLRTYCVFNVDQCDGLRLPKRRGETVTPTDPTDALGAAAVLVSQLGITVKHGGNRAYYSPSADFVAVPMPEQFSTLDHYRATLAHECVHATGHKSRLDRDFSGRFGTNAYAFEELVAELGSAMVGARLGFDSTLLDHHASYLQSWLDVLKGDRKALMHAASKASAACNYLVPVIQEEEAEEELAIAA